MIESILSLRLQFLRGSRRLRIPVVTPLAVAGLAVVASLPAPASAQRRAVLDQVKVPHNYYYREMFLPQVTSGPSAAAWLPDGKALVVAMQGSLWRVPVEGGGAEELTSGPGYAYQPDVAPDGRRVVFSYYVDDQVELRLLDLEALTTGTLLRNGAVNVEPRWSPDGTRIAFTSTVATGRFHVFTVTPDGKTVAQLTEEHDSGLPRYYYSRFDHYLHPTWSPDGRELLVVSNRGKIWGSGGLFRMEARAGAELRPLLDEETTWRMRPDWAPDGKRIAYASYLGRQWHQLWLTTAAGGDPLQLTYGDFDVTNPRWSPDGRRVAYISNETGNTSLWVVTVPGGARTRVDLSRRTWRGPMVPLTVTVLDAVTARPVPARLTITGADGRGIAPDDAWRHADDAFDRRVRPFEVTYFHTTGTSRLLVPQGKVTVTASRGLQYEVVARELQSTGAPLTVTVRPSRLLPLPGWTSGDLHVHMNYGGHYRATPATLALQARAEGLNVVENLIVNKEDRMPDVVYFTGAPDPVSTPDLLLLHDQEFHTSYWGHTGALGLTRNLLLPGYTAYAGTPVASLFPDNATVAAQVHAQGGLFGYVHPFDELPNPADTTVALTNALPVDAALGLVDYYEAVGFDDHLATNAIWYRLLNCGFRIPAGAGTDAMTNFASLRGPVGMNRVYVQSGLPLDRARWYAALKAGKTFATNGPLLQFSVNGQGIGSVVSLYAEDGRVTARVTMRSIVPVDHVEIIRNGEVVADLVHGAPRTSLDTTLTLTLPASSWLLVRARADEAREPVLDTYPFGTTSPIYVELAKRPFVPRREDVDFFLAWVARLDRAASAHPGWNTPAEKREVLGRIAEARAVFEGLR